MVLCRFYSTCGLWMYFVKCVMFQMFTWVIRNRRAKALVLIGDPAGGRCVCTDGSMNKRCREFNMDWKSPFFFFLFSLLLTTTFVWNSLKFWKLKHCVWIGVSADKVVLMLLVFYINTYAWIFRNMNIKQMPLALSISQI